MKFTLYTGEADERPIFITGNFNTWNPKDPRYQLTQIDPHNYYIEIFDDFLSDIIEFKFTKGGWENVELDLYGSITPNKKVLKSSKNGDLTGDLLKKNFSQLLRLFLKNFTFLSSTDTEKSGHFYHLIIMFQTKNIRYFTFRMHKICSMKEVHMETGKLTKNFLF